MMIKVIRVNPFLYQQHLQHRRARKTRCRHKRQVKIVLWVEDNLLRYCECNESFHDWNPEPAASTPSPMTETLKRADPQRHVIVVFKLTCLHCDDFLGNEDKRKCWKADRPGLFQRRGCLDLRQTSRLLYRDIIIIDWAEIKTYK